MNLEQRKAWNVNHKLLTGIISKTSEHSEAIDILLRNHLLLHSLEEGNDGNPSLSDALLENLKEDIFRYYPVIASDTKNSIAWHLWHLARIEDMTMNILVAETQQVLHTDNWLEKMKIRFVHSGNEMKDEDIAELSSCINLNALVEYRKAVGKQTQQIISSLQPGDFKEKVQQHRIQRLFEEKALLQEAKAIADYWSKKTIGGILLMPATRHNFLHLNKCIRIKNKQQKTFNRG